jgi:hypothetical protein
LTKMHVEWPVTIVICWHHVVVVGVATGKIANRRRAKKDRQIFTYYLNCRTTQLYCFVFQCDDNK